MQFDFFGRPFGHQQAARVAAFRAQVDQPVGGADHVQVVLDHQHRIAAFQQFAQGAHQFGDVIEMQPGGRLVEHEQRAARGGGLPARGRALGRLREEAGQLQALRLTTRQGRHRLSQLHVFEPHVDDRLQRADHVAVVRKQHGRLAHGEIEHVGHVHRAERRRILVRCRLALDRDLEDLGSIAFAVAVRTAQVHVGQELHLDMLEPGAAAGRAAPVARIEAEFRSGVAALPRQWRRGEDFADRVPGADIARRIGARRFADRRLIDEHDVAQMVGAEQAVVHTRALGGAAEMPHQRRRQHILDQGRLARARNAGHADQPLQRKFDRQVFQVVLARAFQDQPRRGGRHGPLESHADVLARAEVRAGQRVGLAQFLHAAVEHDLPAALARPGAHVDDAVGRDHHRRIVFHHHQRVARIAQPLHGFGDAVHVARMQADAGLVEHEQRVDERSAERGGQVDALYFAARQRAALAIQRQIADAHVDQVLQAGGDLFVQQLERLGFAVASTPFRRRVRCSFPLRGKVGMGAGSSTMPPPLPSPGGGGRHTLEEPPQPFDRHQHQVVQAQARQRLELLARPASAHRQETLRRRHAPTSASSLLPRRHNRLSVFRRAPPQLSHGV